MNADEKRAEKYARARTLYVENRLTERDELNAECLEKMESCDPKLANALQSHYRERVRQLEWDVAKLLPRKYGDRIDVTTDGNAITREINITPVSTQENQ